MWGDTHTHTHWQVLLKNLLIAAISPPHCSGLECSFNWRQVTFLFFFQFTSLSFFLPPSQALQQSCTMKWSSLLKPDIFPPCMVPQVSLSHSLFLHRPLSISLSFSLSLHLSPSAAQAVWEIWSSSLHPPPLPQLQSAADPLFTRLSWWKVSCLQD